MRSYFTSNVTPEERNSILDKHKEVYNGYSSHNITPPTQPLYVQDLANDKNGVTVTNKGFVKNYTNMNINEQEDRFEMTDKYEFIPAQDEEEFDSYDLEEISDEDKKDYVKESVEKSLDMFKRFKNFN